MNWIFGKIFQHERERYIRAIEKREVAIRRRNRQIVKLEKQIAYLARKLAEAKNG